LHALAGVWGVGACAARSCTGVPTCARAGAGAGAGLCARVGAWARGHVGAWARSYYKRARAHVRARAGHLGDEPVHKLALRRLPARPAVRLRLRARAPPTAGGR
jgi:hypothetical protein